MIKLSILIATMPSRKESLVDLKYNLETQTRRHKLTDRVEVIVDASMHYNIGAKRNKLLQQAKGEYIVFIDDDDHIAPDYIAKILPACNGVDCIGISGIITTNGANQKQWHISKEYGSWYEANGIYYRTPNHISPVRRELALQSGFPETTFGEDFEYSKRLMPLIKTENIVKGAIYHYDYKTVKK